MKGDFSHWHFDPADNLTGVHQQQGRVLLDRDWNDQTHIVTHWQTQAGRDVIGTGIAAVPVTDPDGFRVVQATVGGTAPNAFVQLQLLPGHAWVDGLLCHLSPSSPGSTSPVTRRASYLQPPVDPTPGTVTSIAPDVRDAVILEVSREELNSFQLPDRLLEPALGGPDTTERSHLRLAYRLYRLGPGETCHSIRARLRHDPAAKGRLTVGLQPTVEVPGDCPVVLGGGYTGFEHHFYRVEIAAVNAAQPPSFKWSPFNGGLVGRGRLASGPNRIVITANQAAILNSGFDRFYLEVTAYNPDLGTWETTFGADAVLNGSELSVGTVRLGAFSASTATVFFRLWSGIRPISGFTGAPGPLADGILLTFDPVTASNYSPGDFWTFPVRAGEIANPATLIDQSPPFGPVYHRASLAEITWGADRVPVTSPPDLEDCRRRFRPLARLDNCCSVRVGDGITSLGDYTRVQDAIDALPPEGGSVCILPGVYLENIVLRDRQRVTLSGCGPRTILRSPAPTGGTAAAPVILVTGGGHLAISSLAVEAHPLGAGIVIEGFRSTVDHITLDGLLVTGGREAALRARFVRHLTLRSSLLRNQRAPTTEHTVVLLGEDLHVERNTVTIEGDENELLKSPPAAFGGLHLEGGCERVRVTDNLIRFGSRRGITLGSVIAYSEKDEPLDLTITGGILYPYDPCEPSKPATGIIIVIIIKLDDGSTARLLPGPPITGLRIERNRIHSMGMDGIGVYGFFDLRGEDAFITVRDVEILDNDLRGNLKRRTEVPEGLVTYVGFGGIALADVENLTIRGNTILGNGREHTDPVCGIFVLHGEGIEITGNRILENGTPFPNDAASRIRPGHRGGIVVPFALAPTRVIDLPGDISARAPAQSGEPALALHHNVVVAPTGPALAVNAVGPVVVSGNSLTSRGVDRTALVGLLAGTVRILNLGLSNEVYLQYLAFSQIAGAAKGIDPAARPGLDDMAFGRHLANGNILFNNNQVTLDLFEAGISLALTSALLFTLDDLACDANQFEANLSDDLILCNAIVFGLSTRLTDNRFKEGINNALISALSAGLFMNTTAHNQGTHCILATGIASRLIDGPNTTLVAGIEGGSSGDPSASSCQKVLASLGTFLARSHTEAAATGRAVAPTSQAVARRS